MEKADIFFFWYIFFWWKGLQRVVVFTEDQDIYNLLGESEKIQAAEQEIILLLQNVGVSLVNNTTSQEVSFIGITWYSTWVEAVWSCSALSLGWWERLSYLLCYSSDVVWESQPRKKKRWKILNIKEGDMLEKHFKEYINSSPIEDAIVELENNYKVELLVFIYFFLKLFSDWKNMMYFYQ